MVGRWILGDALVEHINKYYDAPTFVDHVVCTHPDADHASGLRKVLDGFQVGRL
jgi:glyoxylase-like metal-dependent hydrolase (beta-lactamase superfamily II)